eukprot:TRINITY_DN10668_c0_g1_i1.p1 TRINITY_DN10668_c0_g1~~TRINITY_DN10668_c0_g1_i1.p1  ORF type:complete len:629 (-),score=120.34 TRINITY_DN10668_c0_g1_i1:16-1878(-)
MASAITIRDERKPLITAGGHAAITPVNMAFRDIRYSVPAKKKNLPEQQVLNGVSGFVQSGQVLALIGPSGAGKTTLLDVLAMRTKSGTIAGKVVVNGRLVDAQHLRRVSAYVLQEDLFYGNLTVWETINFSAWLRLPGSSKQSRAAKIDEILATLKLDHVRDRRIGTQFVRGISGGEQKRTSIAAELVTDPSLLFLDEPTTGLDAFNAHSLVRSLKNLAHAGRTIVLSIHQPRANIFKLFDSVLLLTDRGHLAYFGPTTDALSFMESVAQLRPEVFCNPADFLLDAVVTPPQDFDDPEIKAAEGQPQRIADAYALSDHARKVRQQVDAMCGESAAGQERLPTGYPTSAWTQFLVVSMRAGLNNLRDPMATFINLFFAIFFGVLIGSIYFRLEKNTNGIQDRMGGLFFIAMNGAFSNLGALEVFMHDRAIFRRERANAMYRPIMYFAAKVLQDLPSRIVGNVAFGGIAYWMMGLNPSFGCFLWFIVLTNFIALNSYSLCLFVSSFAPSFAVANMVSPLIIVMFLLPAGFLLNADSLPIIWGWLKYVSFFRYGFQALALNEFVGLEFSCGEGCTVDGTEYVRDSLHFDPDSFGGYAAIVGCQILVYLLFAYILLSHFQREKR